ncbi:PARP-domain-containing protein [Hypomontagnella monticulosa]|nr:PARP-domain-containing protein [Hypomontagnella monticulosa]
MPPRKKAAAKPATLPLQGCSIALTGTFTGYTHAVIVQDFLTPLGATLAKSVTATTSHLVATEADFNKPSVKVKAAQSHSIHIVSFLWLEDSLSQKTRMGEDSYSLDYPSSQPLTNGSRKRANVGADSDNDDDEEEEEEAKPQPKKQKGKDVQVKAGKQEEKEVKEAKVAVGQIAKSRDVRIPLDEGAEKKYSSYEVYIDDDGVIYDASLNQTNATNNNNKFYRVQVLRSLGGNFVCWTRWGRVGESGQSKPVGNGSLGDALREFNSKFKSKSGLSWADRTEPPKPGKYAFIERSYEPDSEDDDDEKDGEDVVMKDEPQKEPESKLSKPIQELMELIFNQQYFAATMADLNYDAAKLPLGKLSKSTITRGFQALKDLSALLDDPTLATSQYQTNYGSAIEQLSNLFFTLIPHDFGRNRPPVIRDSTLLKKEIELLESLSDMKDASLLMKNEKKQTTNVLDQHFQGLGMDEMTPLDRESSEFIQLQNYLMETRGDTHNANYQVSQIFRIERNGEKQRFESAHGSTPSDRRLLWHGSRCTNFGGILSQGLRIAPPEAPVSGYMFGKGIYLADMSSKSANYCCSYISNGHALLLLCEAELGDPMQVLTSASYGAAEDAKAKNMLSTWGQGSTGPSSWKDGESIHPSLKGIKVPDVSVKPGATGVPNAHLLYNEYICYDVSQVRLRYLFRVRM